MLNLPAKRKTTNKLFILAMQESLFLADSTQAVSFKRGRRPENFSTVNLSYLSFIYVSVIRTKICINLLPPAYSVRR